MQERYIATADLGSSKIALCVAKVVGEDIQVIYYRETASAGIRYNCVFNPMLASQKLREAVNQAEGELKIRILQLVVGLPRYNVKQVARAASLDRDKPDSMITREEVTSLKETAMDNYPLDEPTKEEIYGAVAQSFEVDDTIGSENDIIGTTGDTIKGNFKIFLGARKSLRNMDIMLNDCKIACASTVFTPHAVAGAVLTDDERVNGVALVEVGAGVTSLTIYKDRILRFYAAIPFGGKTITNDIRYECSFSEPLAENVKLAFGACMPEKLQTLSDKIIQINDEETGSYETLPVKYLSEIITARSEEIIDAVLYLIQESGYAERLRGGMVITGGGANMANLVNLFKDKSGYHVRLGLPRTRKFSAEGCPGINDAGAAASVGMVLEACADEFINCIEETQPEPEEEEAPAEAVPETVEETNEAAERPVETAPEQQPVEGPAPQPAKEQEKQPDKEKEEAENLAARLKQEFKHASIKPKERQPSLFKPEHLEGMEFISRRPKKEKEKKVKQPKPQTNKVKWLEGVKNALESTFNNTIGGLYDEIDTNEN